MSASPPHAGYYDEPAACIGSIEKLRDEQMAIARMKVLAAEGTSLTAIAKDMQRKGHQVSPAVVQRLLAR